MFSFLFGSKKDSPPKKKPSPPKSAAAAAAAARSAARSAARKELREAQAIARETRKLERKAAALAKEGKNALNANDALVASLSAVTNRYIGISKAELNRMLANLPNNTGHGAGASAAAGKSNAENVANLEAMLAEYEALKAKGPTPEQIAKIMADWGISEKEAREMYPTLRNSDMLGGRRARKTRRHRRGTRRHR